MPGAARGARNRRWHRLLVVEACLQDHQVVAVDEVDEAVFLGDASRPGAGQCVSELLGSADAGEGSRRASSIRRLMRLRMLRSVVCQWV